MSAISFQNLNKGELTQLLDVARDAIRDHFSDNIPQPPRLDLYSKKLLNPGACFVTLTVDGQLQGCLGTTMAHSPLVMEVHNKARASAYQDRRFMPLVEEQLDNLVVEVSVLTQPEDLAIDSEQALIDYLENNKVGVILSDQHQQALFLPQVWEKLPKPEDFIRQLKLKAGWSSVYWSPSMKVQIFNVNSISGKYHY
ncbi:AmmeMemoRadiSam system protein A [Photobacterium sp. DNB23_23_1]|uniref:AmmeMemoRadiSam system protein A n=1 Tax=Photobacterium pectinilyticum TaxID=2906793 RepID=A0ABT1N0A3_9GAMM|nr:AmmeMemoRadiSam system protein A [Photobacterium sp. ZSDE20]MCQ1057962.1 AmmeMemoRadiSam system protein A [Photobacterium sp. ZSDE20]MDD1822494.1 AmmeMemoRadiSam system protein A [Photobacterium sp. ZSDE20]